MESQTRIYENTSDKEVFDAQLGVTIPAHGRVSVSSPYHMPPSKPEIRDITDDAERHTQDALPTETVNQPEASAAPAQEGSDQNAQ